MLEAYLNGRVVVCKTWSFVDIRRRVLDRSAWLQGQRKEGYGVYQIRESCVFAIQGHGCERKATLLPRQCLLRVTMLGREVGTWLLYARVGTGLPL